MLAAGENFLHAVQWLAGNSPVLLRQEIHREMNAVEIAAFDRQVARIFGAASQRHRVIFGKQLVGRQD